MAAGCGAEVGAGAGASTVAVSGLVEGPTTLDFVMVTVPSPLSLISYPSSRTMSRISGARTKPSSHETVRLPSTIDDLQSLPAKTWAADCADAAVLTATAKTTANRILIISISLLEIVALLL